MSSSVEIKRFGSMIGGSRRMRKVFSRIRKGAVVDMPVLIVGETGSGKELVARELHRRSTRAGKPFVAFNTGAITPDLVASELFGHKKGAFTGATEDKVGRLREAHGGTLFLDEIGTMEAKMQVSLLRALDEGMIRPLGAKQDAPIDFRLVAATNENLEAAVSDGRFRDDLLYRLQVLSIHLPPLRRRLDDIPMLCADFILGINDEYHFDIKGVSEEAMAVLQTYEWPGNLRELKNVLAQATVTATSGYIKVSHLPGRIVGAVGLGGLAGDSTFDGDSAGDFSVEDNQPVAPQSSTAPEVPTEGAETRQVEDGLFVPVGTTLDAVQRAYTFKTLEHCNNNKTQAAKLLNVSRKALYDKLLRWGDDKNPNQ